jgi:hypothetical protein
MGPDTIQPRGEQGKLMTPLRWLPPLLLLLFVCLSVSLAAKGPTTRIVIRAAGSSSSAHITDAATLEHFVVWSGPGVTVSGQAQSEGFIIDWPAGVVTERPEGLPRYEVSFYVTHASGPPAAEPEQLAYVVAYEPDPTGGRGYVYLPGKGEAWDRAARRALTQHPLTTA